MSIKNQNRLPIFALMIVSATVLSLVGLNYLVEGIANKKTPQMAEAKVPHKPNPMGAKDDALDAPVAAPKGMAEPGMMAPPGMKGLPPFDKNRMMPPMPHPGQENGQGAMRRMHNNGKGPFDPRIERTPPPMPPPQQERNDKAGSAPQGSRERAQQPPPPPQGGNYYQPSQDEIMRMEEMERRRMMDYPPPPPPGYYDRDGGGYDDPYDYYDGPPDDFYERGYEGKLDTKEKEDTRTSQTSDHYGAHADSPEDPDSFMDDEYLYDLLDDDDEADED